jgi:predicted MFS family arabinose efflux permease
LGRRKQWRYVHTLIRQTQYWVLSQGHTKKSFAISLVNAGLAVGNIVGPLLFSSNQAPEYHPGVAAVLGIFIACSFLCGFVVSLLTKPLTDPN